MNDFNYTSFILDNSYAAISAMMQGGKIHATDGRTSKIHIFNSNGEQSDKLSSIRPYRRLRQSQESNRITAICCSNRPRVYFLDENFLEIGFVELEYPCDSETESRYCCSCTLSQEACSCRADELIDASLTCIGNEEFIVGVFPKSAYLFDTCGKHVSKLCFTERGEILTDFISPRQDFYALSSQKGNVSVVSISENGRLKSAILPKGYTLRMLIHSQNDVIYGLFGSCYIYNRIIPIYENGVLSLPDSCDCCI